MAAMALPVMPCPLSPADRRSTHAQVVGLILSVFTEFTLFSEACTTTLLQYAYTTEQTLLWHWHLSSEGHISHVHGPI